MTVDLAKFLPMFLQEAQEHLADMEENLLALDPAAPDPEALQSIFRAVHSIKGSSTIFGASRLAEVMHRVETILERIRREQVEPTPELVSVLLQACDGVREELRRFRDSGQTDPGALAQVHEQLSRLAQTDRDHAMGGEGVAHAGKPGRSQRFQVELRLPAGQDITALPLATLYAELGALGRVEDLHAGSAANEPALSLFLLTTAPEEAVRTRLSALLGGENVRVQHLPAPRKDPVTTPSKAPREPPSAGPERTAYGLFWEQSGAQRSNAAEITHIGRRSRDRESSGWNRGRRATDRVSLDRSSIRVDTDKVDRLLNLVGELVIAHSMLTEAAVRSGAGRSAQLRESVAHVGRQTRELQDAVMSVRLLPIDSLFSRMPRLVHDLAQRLGKDVELLTVGGETELDKEMIEKLADPLTHLMRNSLDHGIELPDVREAAGKSRRGSIELAATHDSGSIVVELRDDGAGFDRERILRRAQECGLPVSPGMPDEEVWPLVFTPGFSTAEQVSDVSGRGVGMDVVKRNIDSLGGRIDIRSGRGAGTTIQIRLPLTLAIMEGMSVAVGDETFIIPLAFISEAFLPRAEQIKSVTVGPRVVQLREEYIPLLTLEQLIGVRGRSSCPGDAIAIVLQAEGRSAAVAVDRLLGQQQVVIKSLEQNYRRVPGIGGATVLGNGRVALILDVHALLRLGLSTMASAQLSTAEAQPA